MTKDATHEEDLAGKDQAAPQSQPDVWEQRYNGLKGKLMAVQNQLTEAQAGFQDERSKWEAERTKWDAERKNWEAERNGLAQQAGQLQAALSSAESQLGDLTGKWNELTAQSQAAAGQLARQQVLLKYPQLIKDPVVKLVENSSLAPEDLEATLAAMAEGQQLLVKQVYQEVQTGATGSVNPATAPASAKQEQAKEAWKAALDAMQKGDMATYKQKYDEYLASLDQTGHGQLATPRSLARPI